MRSMNTVMRLSLVAALCVAASAFVTPQTSLTTRTTISSNTAPAIASSSSTQLFERQWNFNDGQGPFGLKKNAEIWNGRVAQMAFVWVLLQELISGKGIIQGLSEGDPANYIGVGAFAVTVLGLTAFLAIKGENDYVGEELNSK